MSDERPRRLPPRHSNRGWTEEEIRQLEARITADPNDRDARADLLDADFYGLLLRRPVVARFHENVLWFIDHDPSSDALFRSFLYRRVDPDGQSEVGEHWLRAVERAPDDSEILKRAVDHFSTAEGAPTVRWLIERATDAHRSDLLWQMSIGGLWERHEFDIDAKNEAVRAYQRAFALAEDRSTQAFVLDSLTEAELRTGDVTSARAHALELLECAASVELGWMEGNAIYTGHSVLGELALADEDIATAEQHLLEAGRTCGSPQLNSFGPEFRLASQLLARGRVDVVIEFLESCATFWNPERLHGWIERIRAGERFDLDRFPVFRPGK